MQEYSTPQVLEIDEGASLVDAVVRHAENGPDDVVFTRKVDGRWTPVTAKEFATEVRSLAAGLVASGVKAGDRVGLMSKTRYEWTLCDYAIWTAGAVTVPIYETSSAEQVQWNLGDSGAVAAIVESSSHQSTFESVRDQLPDLSQSWQIDAGGLEELAAAGRAVPDSELAARRATLSMNSLATIIYTSGTTGRPKGCELTHGNLLGTGRSAGTVLPELFNPAGSTLLFLPLAHVFARLIQVACVETGARMGHTADIKNLLADFGTFQPTFILSVPRVFEKVYNTAKQKAHADGKGPIFDRAEAVAIKYSEALDKGGAGLSLKLQHGLFDKLVYSKLRAAMGGKVSWAVSGGAPLGARLGHFFRGIGVTILEGYGLTETTAAGTVNTPAQIRVGTVGRPSPGVTVRIADDGEILMKGDHVYQGYWHNETATKETVVDGWFHSGDIGVIDDDGFVMITGRKKELIVTAGGKNVAPAVLEDRLRAHPLVSQCMVVGDQQPFIACLVTIDAEAIVPWATTKSKPSAVASLVDDPQLRAEIQGAVDEANKAVSKAEAIRKFTILPIDWTEEGGQLTPSLKLKRAVVMKEFAADVDALYAGGQSG
ncbi:MAG: putative long-chain fatty acid ligase [Frankiales bacterium]|nr:putative long-chain fatty acid ligase [Frankiales bacterium]